MTRIIYLLDHIFFIVSVLVTSTIQVPLPMQNSEQHLTPDDFRNALTLAKLPANNTPISEDDVIIRLAGSGATAKIEFQTWDGGRIPYILDYTFDVMERAQIAKAILKMQSLTCIQFVPRFTELDFVHIQKRMEGQGFCSSLVGRIGGEQPLYLTARCVHEGIILHELMHVLGFEHEHCRMDRDDYVNVTFSNIVQNAQYNFMKIPGPRVNYAGPYDLGSITHYSSLAFGKSPGLRTMMPKETSNEKLMGQRDGLSPLDQQKIKTFYNCSADSAKLPTLGRRYHHLNSKSCADTNTRCIAWLEAGECTNTVNEDYMEFTCPKSCNIC